MRKTTTITARIEPKLKTTTKSILHKGFLCEVKIVNKETLKAMHDADNRKTHKVKNVGELFEDLK